MIDMLEATDEAIDCLAGNFHAEMQWNMCSDHIDRYINAAISLAEIKFECDLDSDSRFFEDEDLLKRNARALARNRVLERFMVPPEKGSARRDRS